MTKGYAVFIHDVHDPEGLRAYAVRATPNIRQAGGRVIAADEHPAVLEGRWPGPRTVIVEFESVEAAQAWYDSPAYQEIVGMRLAAADGHGAIVAGLASPPD